jgi:energy-coupling factor transporter ATP-binding protein EcfA2
MFDDYQICPYTGLRSFTEEESLYFKGREENIESATGQLQRNKFLMVTGASGDGKSSLVYAGIIPNARAGFLRSKYTQWCVADFRPERSPFKNLCKSVSHQLDITNVQTVEAELQHGFSALVDLYRNSKRFIDVESMVWQQANDREKAVLKREAANLLILVDQFEEFFTNPENYNKGVSSGAANLVLNLLLETARISLEEELPIYVVFTMRSDYIGQCAAFRGLPEYIGFSQFFVPRLNRPQLQQVIEEPAELSGNRITRRLTERLIHDLTEGVDQLPILQHALNQIWHAADSGKEEMDLIHYAMVGGMPLNELPDEHIERFKKWFEGLLPEIKACYHEPNLQNVLDTHMNKLYEQAGEYFRQKTGQSISNENAKVIIKTAFICLTKIDQSRAVRNRMTLREITNILGRPEFEIDEAGAVLNIFREPGNTFIRPFILDNQESQDLDENDVLDITHESLIRNWEYLEAWAQEEFHNYAISLDFEQQLNRWVESDKANGFLLSIGQLTYFENWFNKVKPNAYWIARYLPEEIEQDKKLSTASEILGNARDFLKRSARKHAITRTIMRYGPARIGVVLGLITLITLSSFAARDYFRSQNNYILQSIKTQSFEIANKSKLSLEFSIPVITRQLALGNLSIPEAVNAVNDPVQKIRIATGIATQLVSQGRNEPQKEILESLKMADSLLQQLIISNNSRELSIGLKLFNDYGVTAGLAHFLNQTESLHELVTRNAERSAYWVMDIFKRQPQDFVDIQNLSLALNNAINHKIFSRDDIEQLLNILSPFENMTVTTWLANNYHRDKVLQRGSQTYGPRFNGLYQDLAYLYAASGKPDKVQQCMDTLLQYQDNFYQNDYATHIENASNIAAVFYTYGTTDHLSDFVSDYCQKKKITTMEFYNRLVSRMLTDPDVTSHVNFYTGGGGQMFSNLNLKFADDRMSSYFFKKLREEITKIEDPDMRNFDRAVSLKNEGILHAYRKEIRGLTVTETDAIYRDAIAFYQQVSKEFLNMPVSVIGISGADMISVPRKFLFLFPDYRVPFHPFEPRSIIQFYNSADFIEYLLDHQLFDTLYENAEDLKFFEYWLLDYQVVMASRDWFLRDPMPYTVMSRLASKMEERKANRLADLNILYLHLSDHAFNQKDSEKGIAYLQRIQPDQLLNAFQYKNFTIVNSYSLELMGNAITNLTTHSQFDLAYRLLNVFKKEVNRSSLYAHASQMISLDQWQPETAQRLLDSARIEMNRLDNPAVFQPNRHQVAMALMYQNPKENGEEAYRTIKNSLNKFQAIWRFSRAFAFHRNLNEAQKQIPDLIAAGDKATFLSNILEGYSLIHPPGKEWQKFLENRMIFTRRFLPYVNENE